MPWLACESHRIHDELAGPEDGPACVLVNGLTQYLKLWIPFRDALVARGFRVASYAPDEVGGELAQFPDGYDHLRSIPVQLPRS